MQSISRFRPLQPLNSHRHPRTQPVHQPWLICRNFVYRGVCKEISCPRAHVPHRDMLDLLDYLITRRDFPPELRSARKQLRPPKLILCRIPLPSDRICSAFIPRPCPLGMRCTRTHFSIDNIYRSLMWPADRAQPRDVAVAPPLESEVPATESIDPEHPQSSPTGPSLDAVAHSASQSRTPSNGPHDVVPFAVETRY
ncbi:hypothetical protein EDB92DRAFT_1878392 [Lactarius akahatsu]|uniref:C3H1-type domain-containing protein n=1 Tax=Lactarius akahatsu TaxID=416441 RepID=A0AAD4LGK4_9AGAM|nr:hypothetical protein EDB92DRAFT_1878392 [Lactarius akahatsu]